MHVAEIISITLMGHIPPNLKNLLSSHDTMLPMVIFVIIYETTVVISVIFCRWADMLQGLSRCGVVVWCDGLMGITNFLCSKSKLSLKKNSKL
jgi:hypothetical protein